MFLLLNEESCVVSFWAMFIFYIPFFGEGEKERGSSFVYTQPLGGIKLVRLNSIAINQSITLLKKMSQRLWIIASFKIGSALASFIQLIC